VARFDFAFDNRFRTWLLPLGVAPASAAAVVGREHLLVRFGLWTVTTRLDNIAETSIGGPYTWWRTIGVRVSLRDRGLTFGTNASSGVCLRFAEPVRGLDPLGVVRHPGLTMTLADPGGFLNALDERRVKGGWEEIAVR
jgi:hypothetical protein